MKLRCIKLTRCGSLTVGKIYEIDEIGEERELSDAYVGSHSSLYVKGDDNIYRYYDKNCFLDIQQDREEKLKQLGI